jgi:hypothetical protein
MSDLRRGVFPRKARTLIFFFKLFSSLITKAGLWADILFPAFYRFNVLISTFPGSDYSFRVIQEAFLNYAIIDT